MNRDMPSVVNWRTSSYSMDSGGNCVEVGWHISSYSASSGGNCVEVGSHPDGCVEGFAVRDSTRRDLGYLSFPSTEWATFLRVVR